ncbi:MAG: hypothetical protein J6B17_00490 [Ruminococcus sp.]|nr:hypothetical protein [Ruminococcus sp.]
MKKFKKVSALILGAAMTMNIGIMSFNASAAVIIESNVLEDGTIHTRTCNDNGNIEDMYYTPERSDLYLRKENSFTYLLNVSCNNNAEFEKTFSEVYGYTQLEDGSYDVYSSGILYYNFGTNMTYDAAKTMAEDLLKSSCVDTVTLKKGYQIYDASFFEVIPEFSVCSNEALTTDSFAWASDIGYTIDAVNFNSDDTYLIKVTEVDVANRWAGIYSFMLRCMEMPSVYAVSDFMIQNALAIAYNFETVKVYTSSEELICDTDGNGTVEITDATAILESYANTAAGIAAASAENSMDVNGDGTVGIDDATFVLTVYAELAAGLR